MQIDFLSSENEKIKSIKFKWGIESRPIFQRMSEMSPSNAILWADRISPLEAIHCEWAVAMVLEKAMKVDVSDRVTHLRALHGEIQRLVWLHDYLYRIFESFNDPIRRERLLHQREKFFQIQEILTGSRVLPQHLGLGGVRRDLSIGEHQKLKEFLASQQPELNTIVRDLEEDVLIRRRMTGLLVLKENFVKNLNISGPIGQASGHYCDLRIEQAARWSGLFEVKYYRGDTSGDAWARLQSVIFQIDQSYKILKVLLKEIPPGAVDITHSTAAKLPEGEWSVSVEAPSGVFEVRLKDRVFKVSHHSLRLKGELENLFNGLDVGDEKIAFASLGFDFCVGDLE